MTRKPMGRIREALHLIPVSERNTWWRMGLGEESERNGRSRIAEEHG